MTTKGPYAPRSKSVEKNTSNYSLLANPSGRFPLRGQDGTIALAAPQVGIKTFNWNNKVAPSFVSHDVHNRVSPAMPHKVLIVEDEMLVAGHLEMLLEDMGFEPVGVAATRDEAQKLADARPDIALVDCNLRDGLTGPEVGAWLTKQGVKVVFMTANPSLVKPDLHPAIGVISKPCGDECLGAVMSYLTEHMAGQPVRPPAHLFIFS